MIRELSEDYYKGQSEEKIFTLEKTLKDIQNRLGGYKKDYVLGINSCDYYWQYCF